MTQAYTRAALTLAMIASAATAGAQGVEAGPRWTAWLGCWSVAPADMQAIDKPSGARLVCVTPTADANVAHVSLRADGKEFFRDTIDASGTPRTVERNGCTGSERAAWSSNGRRVYLKSSIMCGASATDVAAILSLTSAGEWLDVRSISTGNAMELQVTRYQDVGTPSVVPAEVAAIVAQRSAAIKSARVAAAAKPESNDIIELWRVAGNAQLVETWILENDGYAVNERALQELADAGVPAHITDAMVAVDRAGREGSGRRFSNFVPFDERMHCYGCDGARTGWDQNTGERVVFQAWQYEDPWNYSIFHGFFGPYGQFGYPNRIRGYDGTYSIIGAGVARTSVQDLRPPVITLTNTANPNDTKAKEAKDDSMAKQTADAIVGAAVEKAKNTKPPTTPKNTPRR